MTELRNLVKFEELKMSKSEYGEFNHEEESIWNAVNIPKDSPEANAIVHILGILTFRANGGDPKSLIKGYQVAREDDAIEEDEAFLYSTSLLNLKASERIESLEEKFTSRELASLSEILIQEVSKSKSPSTIDLLKAMLSK